MYSFNGSLWPYPLIPTICLKSSSWLRWSVQFWSITCINIDFSRLGVISLPKLSTFSSYLLSKKSFNFFSNISSSISGSLIHSSIGELSLKILLSSFWIVSISQSSINDFSGIFSWIISRIKSCLISWMVSLTSLFWSRSNLCSKITFLWSFITLSNLRRVFLISKFLDSTFFWALSRAVLIHGCTIDSPSSRPSFFKTISNLSEPKILIKSSSRLK